MRDSALEKLLASAIPSRRKRVVWVIYWDWGYSDTRKPKDFILHFLNPRCSRRGVLEYIKKLYVNSEQFLVAQRFRFFLPGGWNGLFHAKEGFVRVGDDFPVLIGWHTRDLRIEFVSHDKHLVRWTGPGNKEVVYEVSGTATARPHENDSVQLWLDLKS